MEIARHVLSASASRKWQEHCEFVAAYSAKAIFAAQLVRSAFREALQNVIAGFVPVAIVDGLEAVQIEEGQEHRRLTCPREIELLAGVMVDRFLVQRTRHPVPVGEELHIIVAMAEGEGRSLPGSRRRSHAQPPFQIVVRSVGCSCKIGYFATAMSVTATVVTMPAGDPNCQHASAIGTMYSVAIHSSKS